MMSLPVLVSSFRQMYYFPFLGVTEALRLRAACS